MFSVYCVVCMGTKEICVLAGSVSWVVIICSTKQTKSKKNKDTHTHTHTFSVHHSLCNVHSSAPPCVLSPGWFWHKHRNQKASHINNANCPSGQKWSTWVEYHSELQSLEWDTLLNQRYESMYMCVCVCVVVGGGVDKHAFEYKFDL